MGWLKKIATAFFDTTLDIAFDAPGNIVDDITGQTEADKKKAEHEAKKAADAALDAAAAKAAAEKTERDVGLAQSEFAIQQQDALTQAGKIEKQAKEVDDNATEQESLLARSFKNNMRQLGAGVDEVNLAEQQAKTAQESTQGSLKAALGASGTRAGSTQEKTIVQNSEAFQQALTQSNKSSKMTQEFNISGMLENLAGNRQGITTARNQANEAYADATQLRSDYSEGGRAVNLFNQQITNRRADSAANINLSSMESNFKQAAYDRAIERAKWTWEDGFVNIFNLASSGLGMASSVANLSTFLPSGGISQIGTAFKNAFKNAFKKK